MARTGVMEIKLNPLLVGSAQILSNVSMSAEPEGLASTQRSSSPTLSMPVSERDHIRGADEAPVTLVQYGDFECASCGDMYSVLKRIQDRLGARLRFVFRHFPMSEIHPHARQAAAATEAAAAQDAFWEMHDRLYEHQDALGHESLLTHAAELNLDTEQFKHDLEEDTYEKRISADFDSGLGSTVEGTPTLFINGERYEGSLEFEPMLRVVAQTGGFSDLLASMRRDNIELRDTIDRSERGAPAAGRAIRDRFSADEIFQRIVATADEEFNRSNRLLFMSGLAAGLALALTFLARSAVTAAIPGNAAELIGNLLYPVGFVLIVMGRYQLFTENTLTPVTLVLTRIASLPSLLRVWGIVIVANVLGAAVGAFVLANTGVFAPETAAVAGGFGEHALTTSWWDLFFKAVFAGNIVAGMVWLMHACRDTTARFLIIVFLMFLIPSTDLYHCITGVCEVLYVVFQGHTSLWAAFAHFFVPVVLGNTVGGVLLVALLNFSQTEDRRFSDRDPRQIELSWSEWLCGRHAGRPPVRSLTGGLDSE